MNEMCYTSCGCLSIWPIWLDLGTWWNFFLFDPFDRFMIWHVIKKVILIKITDQKNHVFFMPHVVNLSMKEGSFFCFLIMRSTEPVFQITFLVSLENSRWGRVHGLGSMVFGLVVQIFLNIGWLFHWKLN